MSQCHGFRCKLMILQCSCVSPFAAVLRSCLGSCSWTAVPGNMSNRFLGTLLGNLFLEPFLGTLLGNLAREPCMLTCYSKPCLRNCAWKPCFGTFDWNLAWGPVLGDLAGNLLFGTFLKIVLRTRAWEPVLGNLFLEPLLGNLFLRTLLLGSLFLGLAWIPCLGTYAWERNFGDL